MNCFIALGQMYHSQKYGNGIVTKAFASKQSNEINPDEYLLYLTEDEWKVYLRLRGNFTSDDDIGKMLSDIPEYNKVLNRLINRGIIAKESGKDIPYIICKLSLCTYVSVINYTKDKIFKDLLCNPQIHNFSVNQIEIIPNYSQNEKLVRDFVNEDVYVNALDVIKAFGNTFVSVMAQMYTENKLNYYLCTV